MEPLLSGRERLAILSSKVGPFVNVKAYLDHLSETLFAKFAPSRLDGRNISPQVFGDLGSQIFLVWIDAPICP